jgi:hypothetical protein
MSWLGWLLSLVTGVVCAMVVRWLWNRFVPHRLHYLKPYVRRTSPRSSELKQRQRQRPQRGPQEH